MELHTYRQLATRLKWAVITLGRGGGEGVFRLLWWVGIPSVVDLVVFGAFLGHIVLFDCTYYLRSLPQQYQTGVGDW